MPDNTSDPGSLAQIAQRKAIRRRRQAARRAQSNSHKQDQTRDSVLHLSPTQRAGRLAEDRAAAHVAASGGTVLHKNLLCRAGEIDLVCLEDDVLVFIEVRKRDSSHFGGAAASVGRTKQQRLTRAAAYFLPRLARQHFGGHTPCCRFDVIALEKNQLFWLKGVFDCHF